MNWARCEVAADGLLDQPIDVLTGLVAVAAGVWFLRGDHRLVGAGLVVSGIASAAYHAWTGPFTGWLDGAGVALVALAFAADAGRWPGRGVIAAGAGVAGLTAPTAVRSAVTAIVVGGAVLLVVLRERIPLRHLIGAGALLGAGLLAWWIAADDARCSPDGWVPLHGLWHLAAIGGVSVLVVGREPGRSGPAERGQSARCRRVFAGG